MIRREFGTKKTIAFSALRGYEEGMGRAFALSFLAVSLAFSGSRLDAREAASVRKGGAVSVGSVRLTSVQPRVFTPNGDGRNDKVIFQFDNPALLPIRGEVYDLAGAKVADLTPWPASPDDALTWDGRGGGRDVPGGVYIFQVEADGEAAGGTVVVAR
jgi:hypothetical protein